MNFEQKINEEIKLATKSGEKLRLETLRSLRAAIIEFNKSGIGREMNDEDGIKILNAAAKKRKDAIAMYEQGGRYDLADKENTELFIIQEFLPKQMSEDEIIIEAKKIIEDTGASSAKDMGKV
ncbi:MAG: uncharacterized protein QG635_206, partial [Bacteroidota bacterium]|nr:uncharacterized protein [Bacteroidota bacterium]